MKFAWFWVEETKKIEEGMECLVRLREEVMKILEELETVYSKLQDKDNERKTK